jgi:hypothetical protein
MQRSFGRCSGAKLSRDKRREHITLDLRAPWETGLLGAGGIESTFERSRSEFLESAYKVPLSGRRRQFRKQSLRSELTQVLDLRFMRILRRTFRT